jgi:hypothetical protein
VAQYVIADADIFAGSYEFSCYTASVKADVSVAEVDFTTMCSGGWSAVKGGLKTWNVDLEGFNDQDQSGGSSIDSRNWAALGTIEPWGMTHTTAADAGIAYFGNGLLSSVYPQGPEVGAAGKLAAKWAGSSAFVRGQVAVNGAKTATGNGTTLDFGTTPTTSMKVYGAIWVTAISGTGTPTITVKIQSDDNSGMTTPTDRITFSAVTAIGAQFATPITFVAGERYWRMVWTVSGSSPSLTTVGMIGIQ